MKRLALASYLLAALSLTGCQRSPAPGGSPSQAPAGSVDPQRIVSIAPSVTEILFAVGAGGKVVATDDYSNYPPDALKKPHVGGVVLNYEQIVALKPDLVIGVQDLQGASLRRLKELRLNVLAIDTTSYDKTVSAIREVGVAAGDPRRGEAVANALADTRDRMRTRYAGRPGATLLVVAQASPSVIVMGKGTFVDDLVRLAGGRNASPVAGFTAVSREALARLHPDVILVGSQEEEGAMRRRYQGLPGPVPHIEEMPPDILVRPGPRLSQGLEWLAREVHRPGLKGARR